MVFLGTIGYFEENRQKQGRFMKDRTTFFEQATNSLLKNFNLREGITALFGYLHSLLPLESIRLVGYSIRVDGESRLFLIRADNSDNEATFWTRPPQHWEELPDALHPDEL